MFDETKVCQWITAKTQEGRGAVVFCLEENNGFVGVWVGEPSEHEKALGYGDNVVEAVLDAISKEAAEPSLMRGVFTCPVCEQAAGTYTACSYCGSEVTRDS